MATRRRATPRKGKILDAENYSALDQYTIALNEYYRSLRRAGFDVNNSLWLLSAIETYPKWILPKPVDPNKIGSIDYDDED